MKRRSTFLLSSILSLSLLGLSAVPTRAEVNTEGLRGFSSEKASRQKKYEQLFMQNISSEQIGKYSREMSKRPSLVGSEGNQASLNYALKELKQAGLRPEVKSYDVYMSVPRKIRVTQTAPEKRELKTIEDLPPGTLFADEVVPGYHAYSPAGEVEAEAVYANYGRPEDFAELKRQGISVKDKIVIARYGKNFRGVKPDLAAQYGAKGMIIYSDPEDDGFTRGKVYPEGPWRPADSIQRGSILYIYRYPGDPLTPGVPSKNGVKRIDPSKAKSLPAIQTTPISYSEAEHLLKSMEGRPAPESWQGGLPFTYKLGPGPTKVKLSLDIDYEQRPVNDIIVKIPGSKYPKETVIIGAHRDTWTYGSSDNTSGWAPVMEIARVLGKLYQQGWRPERTIILAGWDGEEYGLLGATEWAEEYRKELKENAVAYLNLDGAGGQFIGASAVPSFSRLIYDVTKKVIEPRTGTSIYDDWYQRSGNKTPQIGQLGSGSDYTAFLQHLGVPSADLGFDIEAGLYHSAYDNTYAMERFVDPGYKHQAAAAQLHGISALRLANADAIPLYYSDYAKEVVRLLEELEKKGTMGVDLSAVKEQARKWEAAAIKLEQQADQILNDGEITPQERLDLRKINKAILKQERDLTHPAGLSSREWYKHQIYAPGLTTGYAAQPLPALSEAQQAGDPGQMKRAVKMLKEVLENATQTAQSAHEADRGKS